MPAPTTILDLVARFGDHVEAYKTGSYNETQLRRDFLDPFFKALGWDMDNEQGYAEAYRDVVHEDQVKISGALKAPDYGFRIGGTRKFFVEAKRPSVRIKEDVSPAYQLRRYAWSAKLPLSILTDFEELAVYDCRIKPSQDDPASKARIFYCRFDEYAEKWDWIESIFSREAILKGSFDKFADTNKTKRGTAEVDADFLGTIEGWRADLAKNLALRNPGLTQRELNFAVQRILDRIVFLRICEDRGIEDYKRLHSISDRPGIYSHLVHLFQQADDRYNSGLFHFKPEKGRHEPPDSLTLRLNVDDLLLKQIIRGLYYPESPYEFRMLSADILGQVYEQFLGKVIRLTDSHRVVVEDKPEVRKAGGVYYTPTYIVTHIVQQTVRKLIEGKSPKHIAHLRVLDPACGSGSFLIGAYQFLLDWYQQWYSINDPQKWSKGKAPALMAAPGGGWHLTTTERKRILLAHIYGVDIDAQAVEVTKLSLLLKVLEGETAQSLQRELIHERVLPDLSENIKCGNSLVSSDFYAQSNIPELDLDARLRINAFDWDGPGGFPQIMRAGGFNAIIGNPPYVQLSMEDFREDTVNSYLKHRYTLSGGRLNTFAFFIEQARKLVSPEGKISFIVPNTLLTQEGYEELRKRLITSTSIESLIQSQGQIFAGAVVETVILVLGRHSQQKNVVQFGWISSNGSISRQSSTHQANLSKNYKAAFIVPGDVKTTKIKERMEASALRMGDMLNFNQAIALKHDRAACLDAAPKTSKHRMVLDGRHITRYAASDSPNYFKFDLSKIHSCKREDIFLLPEKIFMRRVGDRIIAAFDDRQRFALNTIVVVSPKPACDWSIKYVLGILNSKLVNFYYVSFLKSSKKAFSEIQARQVAQIPLPALSLQQTKDQGAHNRIVTLVEHMLKLQRQRISAQTPHEQTAIDRQITSTDAQIDREVYALYGMTNEEIEMLETAAENSKST
ncbi:Eco57I restriction-modification methylase domain-containing protein [Hyalangium gracile]|uniref:Eco57I restriction-modification methylase domain-containing protein n=1 Tax=Hyalangium gracile TaxID=394092 RepID=UPI001CCAFC08|nr:TaqI-like C-terminal specificity domain-containing protein [Hyalangium gracile]